MHGLQAVSLGSIGRIQAISLGIEWAYRPGREVKSRKSSHVFGHARLQRVFFLLVSGLD